MHSLRRKKKSKKLGLNDLRKERTFKIPGIFNVKTNKVGNSVWFCNARKYKGKAFGA